MRFACGRSVWLWYGCRRLGRTGMRRACSAGEGGIKATFLTRAVRRLARWTVVPVPDACCGCRSILPLLALLLLVFIASWFGSTSAFSVRSAASFPPACSILRFDWFLVAYFACARAPPLTCLGCSHAGPASLPVCALYLRCFIWRRVAARYCSLPLPTLCHTLLPAYLHCSLPARAQTQVLYYILPLSSFCILPLCCLTLPLSLFRHLLLPH